MVWAAAAGLGVTGCSSDPAKATADAGKKATSSSASSSSGDDGSSSSSSSSASSSSSGSGDAGKDASSSGGALNSNPKKISCKAAECTTDGEGSGYCCWPEGNAANGTCAADGAGCGDAFNGYNIACDEKADCIDGNICCWGDGQTVCVDSCANAGTPGDNPGQPKMQLCKTDAECGAEKCGTKTCSIIADAANPADKVDVSISVCGKPTNCN